MPPLFSTPTHAARELAREELPQLQTLFMADPAGIAAVLGAPAGPHAAREVFEDLPPAHVPQGTRWFLGFHDAAGELHGVADVVADLFARTVWHIAVYLWASPLHGSGAAAAMHEALEAWAVAGGAKWLRLGVIAGNARAERFWQRVGYTEVRRRTMDIEGAPPVSVRVMVKPLDGQPLDQYFPLVPRDVPEGAPAQ